LGAESQGLADIDHQNKIYYTLLLNLTSKATMLTGWHLTTFRPISSIEMPFNSGALVGVGQHVRVNQINGDVLCTGVAQGQTTVYRVEPSTRRITKLSSVHLGLLLGAFVAIRSNAAAPYLWAAFIDVKSVKLLNARFDANRVASPKIVSNPDVVEAASYSLKHDKIYGMGLKPGSNHTFQRPIIQSNFIIVIDIIEFINNN
jgi:hypothetical protein